MREFKSPYVRFFNADAYGRDVSFYYNGKPVAENLKFGQFSGYIPVEPGTGDFTVSCLNCKRDAEVLKLNLSNSTVYTIASVNIGEDISLYGIRENFEGNNPSMGNLRVCNLSMDISDGDVYANRYKIIGDLDYLEISKYLSMIPDTYEFTIKSPKSDNVLLHCGKQVVKAGKYNTLYLIGRANSNPSLSCVFSIDAMSYEGGNL